MKTTVTMTTEEYNNIQEELSKFKKLATDRKQVMEIRDTYITHSYTRFITIHTENQAINKAIEATKARAKARSLFQRIFNCDF